MIDSETGHHDEWLILCHSIDAQHPQDAQTLHEERIEAACIRIFVGWTNPRDAGKGEAPIRSTRQLLVVIAGVHLKFGHWLVFILLGLIWSTSFLWIKIGVREVGPMTLVAFRMTFGALTAVTIAATQKVVWPHDLKTWGIFAILGPTGLCDSDHPDFMG